MQRQRGKLFRNLLSHDSSSGVPFGQNQPIKAMATGIEPHTTAHGLKIDQISMIVVAIAAQNGQIEFRGEASRASGLAEASVPSIGGVGWRSKLLLSPPDVFSESQRFFVDFSMRWR